MPHIAYKMALVAGISVDMRTSISCLFSSSTSDNCSVTVRAGQLGTETGNTSYYKDSCLLLQLFFMPQLDSEICFVSSLKVVEL